ncbi:MAG TPA: hypothetical protein PLD59_15220 [Tepidisphaeraceae bacterium]|nr:hypothetical protein [Tepidisphaeraceae bacterium]
MPLVIDHQPVSIDQPGSRTVGEVLARLQKQNRLVVHVLIDGEEPDLEQPSVWRAASTHSHTVFVETTDPSAMARDVLDEVEHQIATAESLGCEAASLLQAGQQTKAMENLSACFKRWTHVQEAILKTSQLLRLDLSRVNLPTGDSLTKFFNSFSDQLRSLRTALESRDYVSLTDVLQYELPESATHWRAAVVAVKKSVEA